ncbi:MAG: ribonuclease R, partial [Bacteroidales bacterium]|nr:ribonuclease R [Bacteroidales bacterium]
NEPFKSLNPKQVATRVGAYDKAGRQEVVNTMLQMAEENILLQEGRGSYKLNPQHLNEELLPGNTVTGTIDMKQTGKAYVIPQEEGMEDILIAPNLTNHALHGDTVRVLLFPRRKMHKPEGRVEEILHRAKSRFVGRIKRSGKFAFLIPDNRNMVVDIFIPLSDLAGAEDGEKCVAEMTDWPENMNNPVGRVINRLGKPGNNNVEMQSILAEYDFPLEFPAEAEQEAERIQQPSEKDYEGRKDFRKVTTFTIDPADAKDFDDALSFRHMRNGNIEVGVHIADVSHYVHPGSAIDREAYERGTSVYLVDRTVPMLPEKLCNGVCSLRPNEDKLCFSAIFEMDGKANILKQWFGKTVIHSDQRLCYDEAQQIIEGGPKSNPTPVEDAILTLHGLATIIRKERYSDGAINFESQEVKFQLDKDAKPIGVYVVESKEANWLIEEFMLLANKKVAEWVGTNGGKAKGVRKKATDDAKTFVYRIHDEPNPEKLTTFVEFVSKLGFKINISSRKELADSYNGLFRDIAGRGEEYLVDNIAIRTMAKAIYSTQNIGHYGLGFRYYTHFTSPIRRYPDLMVHRLLERYLTGGSSVSSSEYEEYCKHCSLTEKRAADAERASVKYKQAEYLSARMGEEFPALISGVSKWGIYAEIEGNKCEGMIPIGQLKGDYYMLDEDNYQVVGRRTGKTYKLGDPITIRVRDVNMQKKQIDFDLVENGSNGSRSAKPAKSKAKGLNGKAKGNAEKKANSKASKTETAKPNTNKKKNSRHGSRKQRPEKKE